MNLITRGKPTHYKIVREAHTKTRMLIDISAFYPDNKEWLSVARDGLIIPTERARFIYILRDIIY